MNMICEHHKKVDLGYIAWNNWAQKRTSQKLYQIKCEVCGLYLYPDEINEPENPKVIESIKRHQEYLSKHPKAKSTLQL